MSKSKRKNLITIILLIIVLALLIVFYLWNSGNEDTDEESEQGAVDTENDDILLSTLDKELINRLHVINDNMDITLILEDETWVDENDSLRSINQSNVNRMINTVETVRAIRIINESPDNLEEYGLGDPAIIIEVEQSDGKILQLQVGDTAIAGEGYYCLVNDDGIVYLLDNVFGSNFDYTDEDMTQLEAGPDIDPEYIYHIEVLKKDGEDFELLYDIDNESSVDVLFPWKILKPFEEGYDADGSKVADIQPLFGDFDFLASIEYDSEDLDKYGLENPEASIYVGYNKYYTQTLDEPETDPDTGEEITEKTYHEELDYKIHIGSKDENGNYYVSEDGSNAVYTMEADKVDSMLEVEISDVLGPFVLIPKIVTVDRIDIEIDGESYTMKIQRTTADDEEVATYYYQGEEVEEEVFKDVYQVMIAAKFDARIREEIDIEDKQPYMTLTYHCTEEDGTKVSNTSSYYPHDESFYVISVNGNTRFFADKRNIDNIAETIIEFKGDED